MILSPMARHAGVVGQLLDAGADPLAKLKVYKVGRDRAHGAVIRGQSGNTVVSYGSKTPHRPNAA